MTLPPPHSTQMQPGANTLHPRPQGFSGQPQLCYYIIRTNGALVPLVPADELPLNFHLQGVPRMLSLDQIAALTAVGSAPFTGLSFSLANDTPTQRSAYHPSTPGHQHRQSGSPPNAFFAPDMTARQAAQSFSPSQLVTNQNVLLQRPLSAAEQASNWRRCSPESDPQDIIDVITGNKAAAEVAARHGSKEKDKYASTFPPSGTRPNQDKKEYCTHWVRHGECDYMQQGCLYKHEMPDQKTLISIGFRSTPRWWVEKERMMKNGGDRNITRPAVGPNGNGSSWLLTKVGHTARKDDDWSVRPSSAPGSVELESKERANGTKGGSTVKAKVNTAAPTTAQTPASRTAKYQHQDLLIDFDSRDPTPAYSALPVIPPSAPAPLINGTPQNGVALPAQPVYSNVAVKQESSSKKVFLPPGEPQRLEVMQSNKRPSRGESPPGVGTNSNGPHSHGRQIQVQKLKHDAEIAESMHATSDDEDVECGHNGGIAGSMHAFNGPMPKGKAPNEQVPNASVPTTPVPNRSVLNGPAQNTRKAKNTAKYHRTVSRHSASPYPATLSAASAAAPSTTALTVKEAAGT